MEHATAPQLEPQKGQRTYVIVLAITPDVSSVSVTGHIIDDLDGGNCVPLEGRAGFEHLLTIVDQIRKLDQAGAVAIVDAIMKGQARFRGAAPKGETH